MPVSNNRRRRGKHKGKSMRRRVLAERQRGTGKKRPSAGIFQFKRFFQNIGL